jgi:hypothetical protein
MSHHSATTDWIVLVEGNIWGVFSSDKKAKRACEELHDRGIVHDIKHYQVDFRYTKKDK